VDGKQRASACVVCTGCEVNLSVTVTCVIVVVVVVTSSSRLTTVTSVSDHPESFVEQNSTD